MTDTITSPFHHGEQLIQTQLGVRERMERFGQKVIRDHIPDQHQEFYQQLQYLLVGHADAQGWPWASILTGDSGFIQSPNNKQLHIQAKPIAGDPLTEAITTGTHLGLLGIELSTRRRNRVTGHINQLTPEGLVLQVDQAFGNCPKYIQKRKMTNTAPASTPINSEHSSIQTLKKLDTKAQTLIANSDTFFVASCVASCGSQPDQGVDVSHRGGLPGFVRIDSDTTFTIPDYAGNLHFNTLGNFVENPKAGLLFIDFEQGHLLMLTGKVDILWDSPETKTFDGAERLWRFELDHGQWLKHALPVRWQLQEYSPFLAKKS
jgi:uncharacterized protein